MSHLHFHLFETLPGRWWAARGSPRKGLLLDRPLGGATGGSPPAPRISAVVVILIIWQPSDVFVWVGCTKSRLPRFLEKTGPADKRLKPLLSTLMLDPIARRLYKPIALAWRQTITHVVFLICLCCSNGRLLIVVSVVYSWNIVCLSDIALIRLCVLVVCPFY